MTQAPFDQLSKQYLTEFLEPLGEVRRQYEIPGEAKFVDVWFIPNPAAIAAEDLGLLGQMAQTPALFEPYSSLPSRTNVRVSIMKLVWVQEDERRKAKCDELPEDRVPVMWILAATTSRPLLQAANVLIDPHWPTGVYFMGDIVKTAIVAIDQLPVVPETLLIRVLGRGKTQTQAIHEVLALPSDDAQRPRILTLLSNWHIRMDIGELADVFQQEEIMALSEAYTVWEQETTEKGLQAGLQKKGVEVALNLLKEGMPVETIARVTGLTVSQIQEIAPKN
jgi:hypothetical protein